VVARCLPKVPLGEDIQFAQHESAVEFRQHAGLARLLDPDQGRQRFGVQGGGRIVVQRLQVGGGAEVGQQQEALRDVFGGDFRHRDAGSLQQALDFHVGGHVFALRRGVHGDQGGAVGGAVRGQHVDAEIAAEAGVLGGRARRCGVHQAGALQPLGELGKAWIGGWGW